jgi:adenylylsulfate kinase-like enzyme
VIAAISPYRELRRELRKALDPFLEVFVNAPLAVCRQRDVKGLYARSASGELKGLTGVDDTYEQPLSPDVECHTDLETIEQSAAKILDAISTLRDAASRA